MTYALTKKIESACILIIILAAITYFLQHTAFLNDTLTLVVSGFEWLRLQFDSINSSTPLDILIIPVLFSIVLLVLVHAAEGKLIFPFRRFAFIILFLFNTIYILFRLVASLNLDSMPDAVLSISFVIIELISYACLISLYLQLASPTNHARLVQNSVDTVKSGKYAPSVDVFIVTFNEPVDMLRRTVIGCQYMDYPNKQIWILDDGNRPAMESLAKELGCRYLTRKLNLHAKAGNLNNALPYSNGELIAVFDADCVPLRDFLCKTAGFFNDALVGLVITDQHFYNARMFGKNTTVEQVISAEQESFFRETQSGRDRYNAMLCYGTGFVIRRQTLKSIGNFPTETLAEDWATSIKLQAAGYKTYTINESLTAGAAAESISEYIQQRLRWGQGTLQSLLSTSNPFRIKGLRLVQRTIHAYGILYYFMFPLQLLAMFVPLFFWFFGMIPFKVSNEQLIFFFLPYYVLHQVLFAWVCRKYSAIFSFHAYEYLLYVPLTRVLVQMIGKPFGKGFRVTQKGLYRSKVHFNTIIALPIMIMLLLYVVGISYGVYSKDWIAGTDIYAGLMCWCIFRAFVLWLTLQMAFDFPQERKSVRYSHKLPSQLSFNNTILKGSVEDISEGGVLFEPTGDDGPQIPKTGAFLHIPELGLDNVAVTVSHQVNNRSMGMSFDRISQQMHRRLVEFLYCKPGRWDNVKLPATEAALTLMRSAFRIYPIEQCRR